MKPPPTGRLWMFRLDYPDAGEISDWADEAMHWVVMNRILGDADGGLKPKAHLAESALDALLARWREAVKGQ